MTTPIGIPGGGINPAAIKQLNQLTEHGLQGMESGGNQHASFKDLLVQSIDHVNSMQNSADAAVETLLTGGEINPAEVLSAVQKADLSFRMMQQIRNKLIDAYREIQDVRI